MKRIIMLGLLVFVIACAPTGNTVAEEPEENQIPEWKDAIFKEVETGEEFSLSNFEGETVLVESFAVWCPVCLEQQKEMQQVEGVIHVNLNTDPNEDEAQVLEYKNEHGFDWRYAVASKEATDLFVEKFGPGFVNAPAAPVVLICAEGHSKLLDRGVKLAQELREEIKRC